ncbi:cytochrome c oxidase subunit II [Candidatus Poribacteria bacterium]|nr:cytochrome c oxidase subunit II [Candidatus Poribacteria bacterium]
MTIGTLVSSVRRRMGPVLSRRTRSRWAAISVASLVNVLLLRAVTAQEAYAHHGKWGMPENVSVQGAQIDGLFWFVFALTGVVFIGVELALVIALVRYRARPGARATYSHGNNKLEIIWTAVPALFLAALVLMTQRVWAQIRPADQFTGTVPSRAIEIEIVAQQFAWNIRYAGADGVFGKRNPALVDAMNPIGLDYDDPASADDILTINQLHFPVGQPIRVRLTSRDVIHSFFLPEFRVKQDALPGLLVNVAFQAQKAGSYEIACAELCGLGHYRMKGYVTVHESESSFQQWLSEQAAELQATQTDESAAPAAPEAAAPAADAEAH